MLTITGYILPFIHIALLF